MLITDQYFVRRISCPERTPNPADLIGSGDGRYSYLNAGSSELQNWIDATFGQVGREETKAGGYRTENPMIFTLGPDDFNSPHILRKGDIIHSARLILQQLSNFDLESISRIGVMPPDGRWNVSSRTNPQHRTNAGTFVRLQTSVPATLGQSYTSSTSSFFLRVGRWNPTYGIDEVGQVIELSASGNIEQSVQSIGRNSTGVGFNVFMELWSVNSNDEKITLLATSNNISMSSLPATPADQTFTFSSPYAGTSGERVMAILRTDLPVPSPIEQVLVSFTDGSPPANNGTVQVFGTVKDLMEGNYLSMNTSALGDFPQIFRDGFVDFTVRDPLFSLTNITLPPLWNTGSGIYTVHGLENIIQQWVNTDYYSDGGLIHLNWHVYINECQTGARHQYLFTENAGASAPTPRLEITFSRRRKSFFSFI